MASGWARWLLEQYEFPFEVVYPPALEAPDLRAKYDILIFVGGAIPREDRKPQEEFRFFAPPAPEDVPEEYRGRLGSLTVAKTVPLLRRFLEDGRLCIDNTLVERRLRPIATGRKNYLFCGSDTGGERAAVMYTLLGSCALVGVDPRAYLAWVLTQLETRRFPM